MARCLFGSNLRLMACIRLRIKEIDFNRKRSHILGNGSKWRITVLTESVIPEGKDPGSENERRRHMMGSDGSICLCPAGYSSGPS